MSLHWYVSVYMYMYVSALVVLPHYCSLSVSVSVCLLPLCLTISLSICEYPAIAHLSTSLPHCILPPTTPYYPTSPPLAMAQAALPPLHPHTTTLRYTYTCLLNPPPLYENYLFNPPSLYDTYLLNPPPLNHTYRRSNIL
jgi:hypothetical protein